MFRLLIADDEHYIRTGLQSLDWASVGVEVCAVTDNAINAIQEIFRQMPDIVLSDVKMPGMSGIEFATKMKKINPDCIFVFFSAYAEFSLVKAALGVQAFDYILKPSDPQEILDCIKRATEKLCLAKESQGATAGENKPYAFEAFEIDEFLAVKNEQAAKIMQFIKSNYEGECTLGEASNSLNYSSAHINRILKKNTGRTFHEVLMAVRLFKSREYILNTDMRVSDIAERVGISDQRYFSQVFKRAFGSSPLSYRKRNEQTAT